MNLLEAVASCKVEGDARAEIALRFVILLKDSITGR